MIYVICEKRIISRCIGQGGTKMKLFSKLSILSVLLVAVISVIAGCGGDTAGEKKFLNIATGGTAGTYYPIGGAMAENLLDK